MKQREATISRSEMTDGFRTPQVPSRERGPTRANETKSDRVEGQSMGFNDIGLWTVVFIRRPYGGLLTPILHRSIYPKKRLGLVNQFLVVNHLTRTYHRDQLTTLFCRRETSIQEKVYLIQHNCGIIYFSQIEFSNECIFSN